MSRSIPTACALAILAAAPGAHAQGFLRQLGERAAQTIVDTAVATAAQGGVNPYSQGRPPSMASGASVSSTNPSVYQRYGDWSFKLNELKVGVDEQWQAVIGVRNAGAHRQGMVASEIKVFLITEDGETLANWGEIYKAAIEGPSAGLEPSATLWLEPGDETRIRLRFDGSRNVKPAKIRIQSTGATAQVRTFTLG